MEGTDKTTLKLKLGYDRVYNSNLPLDMTNEIIGEEYIKLRNGFKIRCLKIQGFGETSFIPGPPLGKIGIKLKQIFGYQRIMVLLNILERKNRIRLQWGNFI